MKFDSLDKPLGCPPYQRFFGTAVRFDAQPRALVFPVGILEHPLHS